MKKITVFTPTYNRAYCLPKLYDSLVMQSCNDFSWLLIDDGSSDDTNALVQSWIVDNKIEIEYIFKQNGGMHSAHNVAYQKINTEFNICIDSDDFMPTNAIELLVNKIQYLKSYHAGIIGLDADIQGKIIGTKIPENIKESTIQDVYGIHNVTGDKKLLIKTEIVKEFPEYPIYKNEKLVPLGTLYLEIDQKYTWLCSNEVYCIVEYLPDGSSGTILKQYKKSPLGFAYNRIIKMKYSRSIVDTFKNAIHLVSSAIFSKKYSLLYKNPNPILTFLAIPFGTILNLYIRYKIRLT